MATSQRQERVAQQIRRELGDLFREGLKDDRLGETLMSVTDVRLTKDLSVATVYVSVLGDEEEQETAMSVVDRATGYIRKEIGQRIQLRHVPELRFLLDHSLERGVRVLTLLDKLKESEGSPAQG